MPKIILLNLRAEFPPDIGLAAKYPLTKSCLRTLWYANAGDIVVSPAALDEASLRYVGEILGFDAGTISVVVRDRVLTDDVLLSDDLVAEVRAHMARGSDWTLMPCFVTEGVAELATLLGFDAGIGLRFAAERGSDLLNRKSLFRQLAVGAGVPLARGTIARSPQRLARAMADHLPLTGSVIVKRDNAGGGLGNIVFTEGRLGPLPGARETRPAPPDPAKIAAEVWNELTDDQNPVLVVESYHRAAHEFYFEYLIEDDGQVRFLNNGAFKLRLVDGGSALAWIGLEIPADVPASTLAEALTHGTSFARTAGQLGYRGYINIDMIATVDGDLILNESNARWGGGLVLHTIGERLLGRRYADTHIVSSVRNLRPVSLDVLTRELHRRGLHFTADSGEGAVIVACDAHSRETTEFALITRHREQIPELESRVRETVEELIAATTPRRSAEYSSHS